LTAKGKPELPGRFSGLSQQHWPLRQLELDPARADIGQWFGLGVNVLADRRIPLSMLTCLAYPAWMPASGWCLRG
jgi:hypothetical protein